MSKKKKKQMEEERGKFIAGAIERDVPPKTASLIFDEMMDFASYAFNKSHAAGYAVIAYQTAFLKTYYPIEFMAATLNSFMGSTDRISLYIMECRRLSVKVLPPDVNSSNRKFGVDNGNIRYGLAAIKNVGGKAADAISIERQLNGPYVSFIDFCKRLATGAVNKKCVESLIKCGAFDSFSINRRRLVASFEGILESIAKEKKSNIEGQVSIFEGVPERNTAYNFAFPDIEEFDSQRLLSMEKELLGIYVTGNPLDDYEDLILKNATFFSTEKSIEDNSDQNNYYDGKSVVCAGLIRQITKKVTKNNNMMAFVELEDIYGSMEIIVFPNTYEKFSALITDESKIIIKGKLSIREEEDIKVICDDIQPLKNNNGGNSYIEEPGIGRKSPIVRKPKADKIYINASSVDLNRLSALLQYFGGGAIKVVLRKNENGKKFEKVLDDRFSIMPDDEILKELSESIGIENLYIKEN